MLSFYYYYYFYHYFHFFLPRIAFHANLQGKCDCTTDYCAVNKVFVVAVVVAVVVVVVIYLYTKPVLDHVTCNSR